MKKIICLTAVVLALLGSGNKVLAANLNSRAGEEKTDSIITMSIAPTYTISIPAGVDIKYKDTSTELGTIRATTMKIEPNKMVKVSAQAKSIENLKDTTKVVPYELKSDGSLWTETSFVDTNKAEKLTIDIKEVDWDKAYAGNYKGVITFLVSYVDK